MRLRARERANLGGLAALNGGTNEVMEALLRPSLTPPKIKLLWRKRIGQFFGRGICEKRLSISTVIQLDTYEPLTPNERSSCEFFSQKGEGEGGKKAVWVRVLPFTASLSRIGAYTRTHARAHARTHAFKREEKFSAKLHSCSYAPKFFGKENVGKTLTECEKKSKKVAGARAS